jgi:hypothetical protein
MAGSGRRSRHRRPAARDRPRPGRDLAGKGSPSGLGPVRLRQRSDRAVTGAGLSGALFPRLPRGPGSDGPPRALPELSPWPSGVVRRADSSPLRAAVSPHRPSEPRLDFFESWRSSWSPVTESNRRPSPYHACRFHLMASHRVGLPQARGIPVSEHVALRRQLPGGVVACLVTGSKPHRPPRPGAHAGRPRAPGDRAAAGQRAAASPDPGHQ